MALSSFASCSLEHFGLSRTHNLEVDQCLDELAQSDPNYQYHYQQNPSTCNAHLHADPLDPLMAIVSDRQQQHHQHDQDIWPDFQKDSGLHVFETLIDLGDIQSPRSPLTGVHAHALVTESPLSGTDDDYALLRLKQQLGIAATCDCNGDVFVDDTPLAGSPPLILKRHDEVWDGSNLVAELELGQSKTNSGKKKRPYSMRMHEQEEEEHEDEAATMEPRKKLNPHSVDSLTSINEKSTKPGKQRMLGKDCVNKPTLLAKPAGGPKLGIRTIAKKSRWAEHLLGACISAIAQNNIARAQHLMWVLNDLASFTGNANQRLAAYGLKALFSRITGRVSLPPTPPVTHCRPLHRARLRFLEVSPWHQAIYSIANGGLLEACEGHMCVHVIDIGVSHGTQWPTFIEALATRPSGCPKLMRLTVVQSSRTACFRKEHREANPDDAFWARLEPFAKNLGLNLELKVITQDLVRLSKGELDVRSGEAVLLSAQFRLHQLSNEVMGGDTGSKEEEMSPRDKFLRFLHNLQPEVLVLSENDNDQSSKDFEERCMQAMEYQWRFLDSMQLSMEVTKGRVMQAESEGSDQDEEQEDEQEEQEKKEGEGENDGNRVGGLVGSSYWDTAELDEMMREMMEGEAGMALVNCVACEGEARVERNEGHEAWCKRLSEAGFFPASSSPEVLENARSLLRKHNANRPVHASPGNPSGCWDLFVQRPCCSILRWKALPTTFTSLWKLTAS